MGTVPNKIATALIKHLNLNPDQIARDGLHVDFGIPMMVCVRWEGVAWIAPETFQKIMTETEL